MVRTLSDRFLDGFLLLLPVILSYLLLGALFDVLIALTVPLTDVLGAWLPDVWERQIVAAGLFVALCLVLGTVSASTPGRRVGRWVETHVLSRFAPYAVLRGFARRLFTTDAPEGLQPALLTIDEGRQQPVFVVEEHPDGRLTLFVPFGAMPGVGWVQVADPARVERLDASVMDELGCLFNWGDGTAAFMAKGRAGR